MIQKRRLWAALPTGSQLYGTQTPESDEDTVQIWIPTWAELVSNKVVTIPQRITELGDTQLDVRGVLLGHFVMSLGHNPENMVLAHENPNRFGEIHHLWFKGDALTHMLNVAENMWTHAKTGANVAHAFRYASTIASWVLNPGVLAYPMNEITRDKYLEMKRQSNPEQARLVYGQVNWERGTKGLRDTIEREWKTTQTDEDRDALARWVMSQYLLGSA